MRTRTVIDNAMVVTADSPAPGHTGIGHEYLDGHVVIDNDRIVAVGEGRAPPQQAPVEHVDGSGCVLTPGLVNTHHHLYQWATRGYATDSTLFDWLTRLYPVWAGLDEDSAHVAATAGLGWAALSGATTTADHHYLFPSDGGDIFAAIVSAAARIGVRLHAVRGSMDRGHSDGGLPPDSVVEDTDSALNSTEDAIKRFHDPSPDARVKVAVGPCAPFSVTTQLMRGCAELARTYGLRLHTHLAETLDEQRYCHAEFGYGPVEYAAKLDWLGPDVWLAHAVHLDSDAVRRLGASGTGVAHCPSSNGRLGVGVAPVRPLLDAGSPVGLGVDGAASNESGRTCDELKQAVLTARAHYGPQALSVRDSLWLSTRGGARCLGREDELGALEPGKLADIALWRLDGLGHAGIADPVAALVLGPPAPLERLMCGGRTVVDGGTLVGELETDLATQLRLASGAVPRRAR